MRSPVSTEIPVGPGGQQDHEIGPSCSLATWGTDITGSHEAAWDVRDESGQRVSDGIYLYRLTVGKETTSRRMVVSLTPQCRADSFMLSTAGSISVQLCPRMECFWRALDTRS